MSKVINVMIDLETTGIAAGCGVLSVGAVVFYSPINDVPEGNLEFYEKIHPESNISAGLKHEDSTLGWWALQHDVVREEAFSGTKELREVLTEFGHFLYNLRGVGTVQVWGNGADFDIPILAAAYNAVDLPIPWEPYNGRCYRTLKNLFPYVQMNKVRGAKHNALEDARAQAIHASNIFEHINFLRGGE